MTQTQSTAQSDARRYLLESFTALDDSRRFYGRTTSGSVGEMAALAALTLAAERLANHATQLRRHISGATQ